MTATIREPSTVAPELENTNRALALDPALAPPAEIPALINDRAVDNYCAYTGPYPLSGVARAVFREAGRYLNPKIGKCHPSMDLIAAVIGHSKSQVKRGFDELAEWGYITIERKSNGKPGQHYNEYTFIHGLERNWIPAALPSLGNDTSNSTWRRMIIQRDSELATLKQQLADLLENGVIPNDVIVLKKWNDSPEPEFGTEEEEEDSISISEKKDDESSSSSSSSPPVSVSNKWNDYHTPKNPPESFDAEFVRFVLHDCYHEWRDRWRDGIEGAVEYYSKDWPKFLIDLKRWEEREGEKQRNRANANGKYSRDYQRRSTFLEEMTEFEKTLPPVKGKLR